MHKTVRMQDITPALATKMLGEMSYERQRTSRPEHIKFLANEMRAKRFIGNTIGVCQLPGGTQTLINGYHTLNAIIESGLTQSMPVEVFEVKANQDISKVYARFDRQLKRTRTDSIRVYGLEESFSLPPSILSRFSAASVVIMKDFTSGGGLSYVSDDEVILFMMDWLTDCKKYLEFIKETPLTQVMTMRHVFPIGLMTTRYSDKASEFWGKVATDDGLYMNDPRKTLHDWLKDTGLSRDSNRKRQVTLPVGMRAVAAGWNAYAEERTLASIRVLNTTLPLVIRGTPYDPRWKMSGKH